MLISCLNKFLIHTKGIKSKLFFSVLTQMVAVNNIFRVKSKMEINKSAQILHVVAL